MTYYFRYSIIFLTTDCHLCVCLGIKKAFFFKSTLHTHLIHMELVSLSRLICLHLILWKKKCFIRLAAKSNLNADVLVSKLTECSSKWAKPTLQLVHQLWTEHGALLHAHQEVLTMASIGQVCHMILACSVNLSQPLFSVRLLISKFLHA